MSSREKTSQAGPRVASSPFTARPRRSNVSRWLYLGARVEVRVFRLALLIASVSLALAQQQSPNNKPVLRRIGPATSASTDSLEGFRPVRIILPALQPSASDRSHAYLGFVIARGQATDIKATGDRHLTAASRRAVSKWRFSMPTDGSAPVFGNVEFFCENGRVMIGDVGYHVSAETLNRPARHQ
jgi:hypothetical protein